MKGAQGRRTDDALCRRDLDPEWMRIPVDRLMNQFRKNETIERLIALPNLDYSSFKASGIMYFNSRTS